MELLNNIISKTNSSDAVFQTHSLRIEKLKSEMNVCFRKILNFIVKANKNAVKLQDLINLK